MLTVPCVEHKYGLSLSKAKTQPAPAVLHPLQPGSFKPGSMSSMHSSFLLETIISQADTKMHLKVFLLSSETQQMVFRVVFIKNWLPMGWPNLVIFFLLCFLFFFMSSSSFSSTQTTPKPKTLKHRTQADTNRFLPSRTMMQLMSRT